MTNFGKFLDPLADKLLVISTLLVFVDFGLFRPGRPSIVVARELAIQGLRMIAVEGGKVIAAAWSGKIKTASTMVCFVLLMLPIRAGPSRPAGWSSSPPRCTPAWSTSSKNAAVFRG